MKMMLVSGITVTIARKMMSENKLIFNWHGRSREDFFGWFLPTVIAKMEQDKFEHLSELTEKWTKVEVTILINGVEVNAQRFLEGVHTNMTYYTQDAAQEIINSLGDTEEIDRIIEDAASQIRRKLNKEFNLEIKKDDRY